MKTEDLKKRISHMQGLVDDWDQKAEDNEGNKHNLSTSERQDWIDEIAELKLELADEVMKE